MIAKWLHDFEEHAGIKDINEIFVKQIRRKTQVEDCQR